jgi:hypothetical protein
LYFLQFGQWCRQKNDAISGQGIDISDGEWVRKIKGHYRGKKRKAANLIYRFPNRVDSPV